MENKLYVIKDEDGYLLSSNSIFPIDDCVCYVVHTGRADNLDFFESFKSAELIKCNLEKKLLKYKIHKKLFLKEVNKNTMNKGEIIKIKY